MKLRILLTLLPALTVFAQDPCTGSRDLRLTNGKFATMDKQNTTVSEVIIQDGKFTAVGGKGEDARTSPAPGPSTCARRTAVPGAHR